VEDRARSNCVTSDDVEDARWHATFGSARALNLAGMGALSCYKFVECPLRLTYRSTNKPDHGNDDDERREEGP
jgi:hypothetical protein